ncbi:MAG: S-layer homology domain-containing protein [Candidatus Sericytochromatia bacterium]|nr:S-layer homology domain-containing protein [Candidatus Sericytochromatia bacterium]
MPRRLEPPTGTDRHGRPSARTVIVLAGALAVGSLLGSMPASAAEGPKAAALTDVPPNHWAYNAIKVLMERYRIMGSFPDNTFRGEKVVSRYELAAILALVMDRVNARGDERLTDANRALVDKLAAEFRTELAARAAMQERLTQLEKQQGELTSQLTELKQQIGGTNKVSAHVDSSIIDDPEDKLYPHWTSSTRVGFSGKVNDITTATFGIGGGYGARQTSVSPAIAGASKPPAGDMRLSGTAAFTTKLKGDQTLTTRFGSFGLGALMNLKGYASHWGDGLIGSGLAEPSGYVSRGGRDQGFAAKIDNSGLSLAAGVNSYLMAAYVGYDFGMGDLNIIGDFDHNSIGAVTLPQAQAFAVSSALNLGSEQLGVQLQGGVRGSLSPNGILQNMTTAAGAQAVANVWGMEVAGGAGLKQGPEKTNTTLQLQPAAYVFRPADGWVPSVLLGTTTPFTLAGKKTGEGSLLGDKAGWTVQLGIDNPILPNLVVEASLQQDILFGSKYDGWAYAIFSGVDF